jgi:hypothetical protein
MSRISWRGLGPLILSGAALAAFAASVFGLSHWFEGSLRKLDNTARSSAVSLIGVVMHYALPGMLGASGLAQNDSILIRTRGDHERPI